MKRSLRYATFAFSTMFALGIAGAQISLDVHAGVSGAHAKSSGLLVDTFGDGNLYSTPSLDGVFMNFGAGAMITPRWGFGGEFSFKPANTTGS
jgi:hypothetical protein